VIHDHVGMHLFDYVLVNRRPLGRELTDVHSRAGAEPVRATTELQYAGDATIVSAEMLTERANGDVRHSPEELGAAIARLVRSGRTRRQVPRRL
jgi:hypothetical protein